MTRIISAVCRRIFTRPLFLFFCIGIVFIVASDDNSPSASTNKRAMSSSSISDIIQTISKWKEVYHHHHQQQQQQQDHCRPFVTLSFAQTVDGRIALFEDKSKTETSSNFAISGSDSLLMTHGLRSIHDAILIGGRTFSIDNPRLTNRLWNVNQQSLQPRPVVLDTHLNHLRCIGTTMKARDIIVCCSHDAASSTQSDIMRLSSTVQLLPCPLVDDGRMDLEYILTELRSRFGIRSMMVEGGAQVLSLFMNKRLVDCVCITIAPMMFGDAGLSGYSCAWSAGESLEPVHARLDESKFFPLGNDCILIGKWTLV